jgi:ADP-L-glycero-D-manno-heptose 6-epimerase
VPLAFADFVDAGDLLELLGSGRLGKFDLVLHMGACSSTTERDAAYLMRNNYDFTRRLAEWSIGNGARFVYASSAATYGDGTAGMDDSFDLSYLRRLRPLNMYGYSKHMFDLYAARNGFLERCVGIKYFNVFGPNEQHKGEMRSLVSKAYTQVVDTGVIRLFRSYRDDYRDGEQKRDFIYVKDAAAMTLHLAATERAAGLFNVGAGRPETWLDLAYAVFAAMKRQPAIEFIDMPEGMRGKYQYLTLANIARLRASGYKDQVTPLASAVHDYVTGYLATDGTATLSPTIQKSQDR